MVLPEVRLNSGFGVTSCLSAPDSSSPNGGSSCLSAPDSSGYGLATPDPLAPGLSVLCSLATGLFGATFSIAASSSSSVGARVNIATPMATNANSNHHLPFLSSFFGVLVACLDVHLFLGCATFDVSIFGCTGVGASSIGFSLRLSCSSSTIHFSLVVF